MSTVASFALVLALVVSSYSAVASAVGARRANPRLLASARNALLAATGLISLAVIILLYSLVSHDFSVAYVYQYTSRDLSLPYLISALWAGNAGSLLFWAWLLSVFALVVTLQKRSSGRELLPYAQAVMMTTQAFFLILLVFVSGPFLRQAFVPADGLGLNPMLENPGMILHPPVLLGGYVGFTIPFAFAVAVLLKRSLGDEWLLTIRRWTLFAWLLLGIGNLIGAWWAYVELGWGGYWAWDPVENAGLMPWLVATAFLHSAMMQRRRGILKVWNMVLIILTFTLTIFGTFLTRSGILSSVHTFGESSLGPFFLTFIGIALIGSLGLLYQRSDLLKSETEMESFVSRESTFLFNNWLLLGATFAIFLGTIFPVISEAVRGTKITVGAPFFNQVNGPIFLAIILLTGLCALIGWRRASLSSLVRSFLWPLGVAVMVAVVLPLAGMRQWYAIMGFSVLSFVLLTILYEWFRGTRARRRMRGENYFNAFWGLIMANRPRYGGYIVHLAIIFIAVGVIGSSVFSTEKEATLKPGEQMAINNYVLTFDGLDSFQTESKDVVTATISLSNGGESLGKLFPEKQRYRTREQPVTEVAIRSTPLEDLYVILVGWDENQVTTFKVLVNPLVGWIWFGGGVFVFGGLVAFWPGRAGRATPPEARREAVA
ncbi:MAG: heme lyase CcmF/NrfE family subunit [Chloroflexota bacterium]